MVTVVLPSFLLSSAHFTLTTLSNNTLQLPSIAVVLHYPPTLSHIRTAMHILDFAIACDLYTNQNTNVRRSKHIPEFYFGWLIPNRLLSHTSHSAHPFIKYCLLLNISLAINTTGIQRCTHIPETVWEIIPTSTKDIEVLSTPFPPRFRV